MSENVYTYGIVEQEDITLDVAGVKDATEVYTVEYRSLAAVVSDIDTTDPDRTDEDVEAHNDVLQRVLEYDGGRTIIPMSFGMAFKNTRTLKGVLRGARPALQSTLNDIGGTVELGVKVISTGGERRSQDVQSDVTETLSAVSINETGNELFSDRLILNKSYLVPRSERGAFDDAIDEIQESYDERFTVQYTGPWPPYNFVDIHIGAEKQRGGR
ncbi:gas vesicle protein GvpF [Halorubrum sp. RMP-47]|uniref:Gas vesicle protein GvpF n=1 Tax=Halorubrum miltondacostae TaxID=3076378 RepID=A0ABD5M3U3_9EURY